MGGITDTLFGHPSQGSSHAESHSSNLAYPAISHAMTPALSYTTRGGDMISNLLGLSGGPAQTAGLENFAHSGGMDFLREQGNRQITSNQASKGLLNSGDTLKAEEKYGQGLGSTYLNQYMQSLMGFSNLGLGAANAMSGAGNVSNSVSDSKESGAKKGILGNLMGGLASFLPSGSDTQAAGINYG